MEHKEHFKDFFATGVNLTVSMDVEHEEPRTYDYPGYPFSWEAWGFDIEATKEASIEWKCAASHLMNKVGPDTREAICKSVDPDLDETITERLCEKGMNKQPRFRDMEPV